MKFLLVYWLVAALQGSDSDLRLYMSDPAWIGALPQNVVFASDRSALFFQVTSPLPEPARWMKWDAKARLVSEVGSADFPQALADSAIEQGKTRIFSAGGALWLSRDGKVPVPLLLRGDQLVPVRFIGQDQFVYRDGYNLHLMNLLSGLSVQLTELVFGDAPEKSASWYAGEEKALLDFVAKHYQSEELNRAESERQRQLGSLLRPAKTYLGEGFVLGLQYSMDDRFVLDVSPRLDVAAAVITSEEAGKPSDYAEFINRDGVVKARKARPRVGTENPEYKLALITLKSGEAKYFDPVDLPEIALDRLAEIRAEASAADAKHLPKAMEGPRPLFYVLGGFNSEGQLLVSAFSQDYKDRWIFTLNPETMKATLLDHEYNPAWLDYSLRDWLGNVSRNGGAWWRADEKVAMFLSDRSGWQHLYAVDASGGKPAQALTSGNFEVHNPFQEPGGKFWYLHASKEHLGEMHFYKLPLEGGPLERLTEGVGQHGAFVSPDGQMLAELYGTSVTPPVLRIREGKSWTTIYDGRSEAFKAISWAEPELVSYTNRDGKPVQARLYKPAKPNGAGVIFIHGAGYLQNAHKGWSTYFREFMFNNLLLREGYTVLDPDYQASAGYGRDWRTAIYRHMGGKDLNDIVDGAKFLAEQGCDKNRIGLYGGSYGGFLTLMGLFTSSEHFRCGAALRPVTDWASYNHWYTARILNTPLLDAKAYRRSSPIYFAEGLKQPLLIMHGMVDDNVQFIDSVRLSQKLIELGKKDWWLVPYPVEPHGFKTPSSWYDEYRRIYELFSANLK